MPIENIKITCWQTPDGAMVFVRAEHDVENGSAVTAGGTSLSDALVQLAARIRSTPLPDPIWRSPGVV